MVGWPHRLDGHEFEQTLGDSKGQGCLLCCSPWGCKEQDTIEQLTSNTQSEQASGEQCEGSTEGGSVQAMWCVSQAKAALRYFQFLWITSEADYLVAYFSSKLLLEPVSVLKEPILNIHNLTQIHSDLNLWPCPTHQQPQWTGRSHFQVAKIE